MIRTDPPPIGFAHHSAPDGLRSHPLTVFYCEYEGMKYWLYDSHGFICAVDTTEDLDAVLKAEANGSSKPPSPEFSFHWWAGAREFVHPGSAMKHHLAMAAWRDHPVVPKGMMKEEATKKTLSGSPEDILAALGLG